MKQPSTPMSRADRAFLEYSDVLVAFWAAGVPANLDVPEQCGGIVIDLPIPGTDGIFFLLDLDGSPLPPRREKLSGWALVCYPPEADGGDADGDDIGFAVVVTDDVDVDKMLAVVVPTFLNIVEVIAPSLHD